MPRDPIRVIYDATCPFEQTAWIATFRNRNDLEGYGPTQETAVEHLLWLAGEDDDESSRAY